MTIYERGAKVRRINTLMSACRLIPNRGDILALWNVTSYDEMTDAEIVALQAYMEQAHLAKTTPASDAVRRLRSQVLAHVTKLGIYSSPEDWVKVNALLLQKRICGKLLYMLDESELRVCVKKLRSIHDKKPVTTSRPTVQVTPIYILPLTGSAVIN